MLDVNKELLKFFKDAVPMLSKVLDGCVLRDRTVSRAGKTSAVIFVPKYLLGQRVKVIVVPENTEVAGLRKTIDKKYKAMQRLRKELKKLNADVTDIEDSDEKEVVEKDPSLEDDEVY
jgi:predicted GH43/DUF377 family glycosyl hydrolase